MRVLGALGLLACLVCVPVRGAGVAAAEGDELLDAPGGQPIAMLLPGGKPLPTGEVRDGFIQVALVGWIRASGPVPSTPGPAPAPAPHGASRATAALSGMIAAALPAGEVRYGSGARVAVLGPREDLDRLWTELKQSYEREAAALDARIEEFRRQEKGALSSTDNLTQASQNLDRARKMRRQAEEDKKRLREQYASRVDELFRAHEVMVTVADAEGHYSFATLPPGQYRLFAVFTPGEGTRRWFLPLEVAGGSGAQRDLHSDEIGPDPYFGAR